MAGTNTATIAGGAGGNGGFLAYGATFFEPSYDGSGGSGGIGAQLRAVGAMATNNATVQGGAGGNGGYSNTQTNYGGSGGAGGAGMQIVAGDGTAINNGTIKGGAGGTASFVGRPSEFINSRGDAGVGGAGLIASSATIFNTKTIAGGGGGTGGAGFSYNDTSGNGGIGGAGIVGSNLAITNSGSISGGAGVAAGKFLANSSYSGVPGASGNAIEFTGGTNSLTLQSGSTITGAISLDTSSTTLDFAQATNATLSSAIIGPGSITKTGSGTLTLAGASTFSGGTTIDAGTLDLAVADTFVNQEVASGGAGTGAISFGANPGTLALATAAQPTSMSTFGNTLAAFGTNDSLDLLGLTYTLGAPATPLLFTRGLFGPNTGTISVTENGETETFTLSNSGATTYFAHSDGNGGTLIDTNVVCFASGTRIHVARGDVAVEDLTVGDLAVTASGAQRLICWAGHRTIDCSRHPRPADVMPIRIAAHAFGADRPVRDLFVSPGHSICVDVAGEVLIPAVALVNATTIIQVEVDEVTYWHVELDSHDILLAENLPAESYLDMGNRGFFEEAPVVDLAAGPDVDPRRTHADFCRPFHADGELVQAAREQLRAHAEALGWQQWQDDLADLHLFVDGMRIEAARRGLSACLVLPADVNEVWLMSSATRPCDVARSNDTRTLGLNLRAITLTDGFATIDVALDDARLEHGFWQVEGANETVWRWTNGRARLPAALWTDSVGPKLLRIDLARPALPRWAAPQVAAVADAENELASVAARGAR